MKKKTEDYSWIHDAPLPEEINATPEGAEFLPIGIVEPKLTKLDSHWGTENFKFQTIFQTVGDAFYRLAHGSLEVVITYGGKTRRLVGAATLLIPYEIDPTDNYANYNFAATTKSECIKNAVKAIGKAFGAGLNERDIITTPQVQPAKYGKRKPAAVIMIPDKKMQESFNKAVENNNEPLMKSILSVYPDIKYTNKKDMGGTYYAKN